MRLPFDHGRQPDACLASGLLTCRFALGVEVRGFEPLASSVRAKKPPEPGQAAYLRKP